MSKFKGKLARRIMAVVLSGAMIMSNMSAYAAELAPEQETEIVSEVEETVAAEPAEEEAKSDSNDENAEAETPAAQSSESESKGDADEAATEPVETTNVETTSVETETATEAKTEDTTQTETDTEAVESTVDETETETVEETTTEEESSADDSDEDVKAEDINSDNVTYAQSEWENNQRTTSWEFKSKYPAGGATIAVGDSLKGILVKGAKVQYKKDGQGLSISGDTGCIAIPLDSATTSVNIALEVASVSDNRWVVIGKEPGSVQKIHHKDSDSDYNEAIDGLFGSSKKYTSDYDTTYITTEDDNSKWLYISVGAGETKFHNIIITETKPADGGDTEEPKIEWSLVEAPVIKSAVQDADAETGKLKGSVTVTVTADIAAGRGEKVEVILCDKDGNPIKDDNDKNISISKSSVSDNKECTVTFTDKQLVSTGTYTFKAVLSRKGEGEDAADETKESKAYAEMTDEEKAAVTVDFKLPLAKPAKLTAKNASTEEDPIIELTWEAVEGLVAEDSADSYVISIMDGSTKLYEEILVPNEENTSKDETTGITTVKYTVGKDVIKNIKFGKKYSFGVASRKGEGETAETSEAATVDGRAEIVENEDGIEWKTINIKDSFTNAEGKELIGLAAGKIYGDETILKLDVLVDMPFKEQSTTIEEVTYDGFIKGAKNPKPNNGEIPTEGTAFRMDAVTNAKVWFTMNSSTKTFYFIKAQVGEDGTETVAEIVKQDTSVPNTLKLNMDAGCRYYFYVSGSNVEVCDIKYCNDTTRMVPRSINIAEGLKAAETYGDEKYVLINVLEDMPATALDPAKEIQGVKYSASIQGKTNPKPNAGQIPNAPAAAFKMKAVQDAKVTFVTGSASKTYHLVKVQVAEDGTETIVEDKSDTAIPEGTLTFILDAGYTYYFYGDGTKVKVYDISYAKYTEIKRTNWGYIADPSISKVELHVNAKDKPEDVGRQIDITVDAVVGTKGGDAVTVEMYDSEGNVAGSGVSKAEKNTHVISIKPSKTDSFTFKATLTRDMFVDEQGNETEYDPKESAESAPFEFKLPLDPPAISSVTNLGGGKVEIEWAAAKEATGYTVKAYADEECTQLVKSADSVKAELNEDGTIKTKAALNVEMDGFEVGKTYYFTALSTRDADVSALESGAFEKTITEEKQNKWSFAAYGSSTSITSKTWKVDNDENGNPITDESGKYTSASEVPKNGFSGDFYKGWVNVWSMGGAGKVVPNTIDGLAFYYTEIDPKTTNFRLSATAHVNEWVLSNGQDGFGLMASDQVGENGNGDYLWTNSYQAVVSKIEYNWDGENVTTDTSKPKIAMKIGVGATEKIGATKEDVDQITAGDIAAPKNFSAVQTALDTTYAKYAKAGITTTCNMVGNAGAWDSKKGEWVTNVPPSDASETYVDFELTLEKNNTGYFLSYKMPNGKVVTQKYYDPEALNHIVEDTVYVGFFAARNANVTFKDVVFDTTDPALYEPAEEQPTKYITLTRAIASASVTNTSDYDLIFTSNWDGQLEVRNSENKIVGKADVTGSLDTVKAALEDGDNNKDTKAHIELSGLEVGNNVFTLTFTPSKNMKNPPAFTALRTYDPVTLPLTVEYRKYGKEGQNLYVAPTGKSTATGTSDDPLDIYTAIKYVQPGQTIMLAGGRYSLYKTIKIETSVNGKPAGEGEDKYKNYIKMIADPKAKERPVFDFNEAVTGMTLGGNYWYFKGFDVTRSLDGQKGIQLSGSNNVLDQVNAYMNGNTGVQVSGSGNDTYKYWPQNNLVLNCTSFLNADHGYEDADGFAAKLTIGSGNVFDGCIAAYNADDGWDLFAKLESGQIGSVTIQNCVAYKNGYVLVNKDGKLDLEGTEKNAGNGNGFKMGGDGLPGGSIHDADYKEDENGNPIFSGHKLYNSVAFANKSKGFDSNSCSNNKIRNSVSFNNEGSNVALYTYSNVKTTGYETTGVISYRTKYKTVVDEISAKNQNAADYTNDTTYLWNPKEKAAMNASGNKVLADWFESTTFKGTNTIYADKNGVLLGRNDDGTINMAGFLKLTDKAGENNIGLGGEASADSDKLKGDEETDGTVSVGDGTILDDTTSPELSEELNNVIAEKKYGIYVKYLEEVEYTGTAVKPEIRVYLNGSAFTDYKVSYKNNVNAYVAGDERYKDIPDTKRPTLILSLKGSYQGTYEYYFDIDPVDITTSVSVSGLSALADGKAKKVAPTLIYGGKKLAAGKDYVVTSEQDSYSEAKEYDVTIDATQGTSGNYTGVLNTKFILLDPANAQDISKTAMKLAASSYDYVGKAITPVPEGFNAEQMTIDYINNIDVGKATITVSGKPEAGFVGSKTIPFTIKKTALKAGVNVTVANFADSKEYTGAALAQGKISVIVKDANGEDVVVEGVKKGSKDVNEKEDGLYRYGYTYQYKTNTEAGNATLTVTGIHNYSGSANFKFKITPVAASVTTIAAENGKYMFTNKDLEVGYAPTAEYTPGGTLTNIIVKYNGNTVSKKNYAISYKNNKNANDSAKAVISWKGSLKGTAKTEIDYTITPCDFTSGNITAKSVSDVFTNGKPSIKASDLEKSKVVLVNVKKPLSKNRDYTLEYKYNVTTTAENGTVTTQTVTFNPQDKEAGKAEIAIDENKGLNVTVYAKPVGANFKPLADGDPGIVVAEFRVAYYDIAKAKLQIIDKTTEKTTPIYFVDDTEAEKATLGARNRLNNHTKDATENAPYYMILTHSQTGELSFGNFENRDSENQTNDYTYDYENTAATVAGKQNVTIYGTGKFGGTRVFKYTLVKKTYDLKRVLVAKDTTATIEKPEDAEATTAAIKAALAGKIVINGNTLDPKYINVSYDASKIQSGKSLSVTITAATVNGIKAYSGFKNISIKVQ